MNRLIKLFSQNILIRIATYTTVVSVGLFILAIGRLDTFTTQMQEKRAVLSDRQNIQLNFEEVLELYSRQYETLSSSLDQLRPPEDDVVYLLDDIEQVGQEVGIGIKIKNLGTQMIQEQNKVVRYELSFTGNKAQLESFLEKLDNLKTFIEVQSVNIEQVDEQHIGDLASFQVIFDIFVK